MVGSLMATRIAVLGAGKIGESLISGLLSAGWCEPGELVATARRDEHLQELADRHGIRTQLQPVRLNVHDSPDSQKPLQSGASASPQAIVRHWQSAADVTAEQWPPLPHVPSQR